MLCGPGNAVVRTCVHTGAAAVSSLGEAACQGADATSPSAQTPSANSPASTSNSLDQVHSPSDSSKHPVMWFNGAAADSQQSDSNHAQASQAECSSAEPQPMSLPLPDQFDLSSGPDHQPSMSGSIEDAHAQQTCPAYASDAAHPSMTDEAKGAMQQQQGKAAPVIQSAESLSTWLGIEATSRVTSRAASSDLAEAEAKLTMASTAVMAAGCSNSSSDCNRSRHEHVTADVDAKAGYVSSQHTQHRQQQAATSTATAKMVKRFGQLSVSHEACRESAEPECDIYNLESPGPILIAGQTGALVSSNNNNTCFSRRVSHDAM